MHDELSRGTWLRWQGGRSPVYQALGIISAVLYIAWLHLDNNGLWSQGDAPRHAMNGLFWWDFLKNFPVNPVEFALSYHARYPAINPVTYPPVFYLIEGLAFAIFAPSPYVAKWLVLAFTLLGSLYLMAWLRRWISAEAGWGGMLVPLQPGIIVWSNVVMLNVPSMALGLAAFYHLRRWMEAPASSHVYLTFLFAVLAIMTYFPSGLVVMVMGAWLVAARRWDLLKAPKTWVLTLLSAMIIVPWVVMASKWAPVHVEFVFPSGGEASELERWMAYLQLDRWSAYARDLPRLFSLPLFALAAVGVGWGVWQRRWRSEVWLSLLWWAICYAGLTYLEAKTSRYALVLTGPLMILSVVGLVATTTWLTDRLERGAGWVLGGAMAAMLTVHVLGAPSAKVPAVEGFEAVVEFLGKEAPDQRVFYDGGDDGVFTFYVRAHDPEFKRGVVLGSKLLYASAIFPTWNLTERVASSDDVTEAFRTNCGCRWLAIEEKGDSDEVAAARFLRETLTRKEFQLVKSFPVAIPRPSQIHVYRFLPPIATPDTLTMPFPGLGRDKSFQIKPINR